jgi:hypothetical protein
MRGGFWQKDRWGERKNERNFVCGALFLGELFGDEEKIWEEEDH